MEEEAKVAQLEKQLAEAEATAQSRGDALTALKGQMESLQSGLTAIDAQVCRSTEDADGLRIVSSVVRAF